MMSVDSVGPAIRSSRVAPSDLATLWFNIGPAFMFALFSFRRKESSSASSGCNHLKQTLWPLWTAMKADDVNFVNLWHVDQHLMT